jgi:outer membrane protein OmpA-like peptidoglycan-associated protein
MSSKKTLALALCVAITGCAQTPKNDADGGSWWPFGSSDKVAAKEPAPAPAPLKPAATAPVAKTESSNPWYWPFGSDDEAVKADMKAEVAPEAKKPATVAKAEADAGGKWWWPFGGKDQPTTKAVPMPDPKVTQAWLDDYEPRLREAVKDSNLQLERRDNVLVVTAPVEGSFNPDRPAMLLPVTLGPFTRVAKILEADPKTAVLVLGHSDSSGAAPANIKLSQERAQSIAAIFRLSVKPAAKPVSPAPAAKKAAVPATKKAPVKKAAAKAPAKKAPAKAPAKKTAPAKAAATDKKVAATDATKK